MVVTMQPLDPATSHSKIALAKGLAIAGLVIFTVYYVDEISKDGGTTGGFLPISSPMIRGLSFQLSSMIVSAAAFAVSWGKPSFLVSIVLIAAGVLMVVDGVTIGTRYFAILALPGPIIGFTYGLAVLTLGIVKSIKTGMAMRITWSSRQDCIRSHLAAGSQVTKLPVMVRQRLK